MPKNIFKPADFLIPHNCDMTKWSVVACDQYTSEREYWNRVDEFVADSPSSRKLILPEARLSDCHTKEHIAQINQTMKQYLEDGVFEVVPDSFIYVERWLNTGKLRRGIVGVIDLEEYTYNGTASTLVRATEGTVIARIPPRAAIRRNAPLELSHVMMLIDDTEESVIEPLTAETDTMKQLYDFDLMCGGGHITGYQVTEQQKEQILCALQELADPVKFAEKYSVTSDENVMQFAVGDGNHSLATAKSVYLEHKENQPDVDWANSPLRYAMVELVNLNDETMEFEPIHRCCFSVDAKDLIESMLNYYPSAYKGKGEGQVFHYICSDDEGYITVPNPISEIAVGTLQGFLDYYLVKKTGYIDYIHGYDTAVKFGKQPNNISFLLEPIEKHQLFSGVIQDGALPRKTFSMGEANDKRFYLEARVIQ